MKAYEKPYNWNIKLPITIEKLVKVLMPKDFFKPTRQCTYIYIYIHLLAIRSFFAPKLPLTYWRRWMFIIHHVTGTRLPSVSFQLTRVLWDNFLIARISEHYKRELDILQRIYVYPLSIQKKRPIKTFLGLLYWKVMALICSCLVRR